jgi:hypothetical protein
MATANVALAGSETGTAVITLLARGTADAIGSGSAEVQYDDISGGFCIDVMLAAYDDQGAPVGMGAAGVGLDGDAGFHYKDMAPKYWASFIIEYSDITIAGAPRNAQGWDTTKAMYVTPGGPGGNLPLTGGLNNEIGSIAWPVSDGGPGVATAGFLGYLEFDAVPSVEASLPLVISPTDASYVGGTDNVNFGTIVREPLTILPEPAAALLLIAAVPFLRRRR